MKAHHKSGVLIILFAILATADIRFYSPDIERQVMWLSVVPFSYRIMIPLAFKALYANGFGTFEFTAHCLLFFLAFSFFYFIRQFLRDWFDEGGVQLGLILSFVALYINETHGVGYWWTKDTVGYSYPWDLMTGIFFIGLCAAILQRELLWWHLLFPASIFNYEAAIVLLPAAFFSWRKPMGIRKATAHVAASLAVWAMIKWFLNTHLGSGSFGWDMIRHNIYLWWTIIFACGGLWVFAAFGFRQLPRELKMLFISLPFFMLAMFFFGDYGERRIWTPMIPIILPAILAGLGASHERTSQHLL